MGENQSRIEFLNYPDFLEINALIWVINSVVESKEKIVRKLIYHFVSREKILEINMKHLNHNYETDVITFDYCSARYVKGDVFICYDVVQDNAIDLSVKPTIELCRVIFHGLLHLLGFKDSNEEERLVMRGQEDKCLALLENYG